MQLLLGRLARISLLFVGSLVLFSLAACGGGGAEPGLGSNRAQLRFDVDLHGMKGVMTMRVEVAGVSGVVWGPGVRPDIKGVVGTGESTLLVEGELRSPAAHYVFSGRDQYADFTSMSSHERFRVRWIETPRGLRIIVNPFGPGPTQYDCVLVDARQL